MWKKPSYIIIHFWNVALLLVAVATVFGSCAEYESIFSSEDVPEGKPASVTLTVQLPNMMSVTRAAGITPDDDEAQQVSDLWVGFYNANGTTGERAGIHYDRYDQVLKKHEKHITIKNIKFLSGEYYIVAVANPSLNKGLDVKGGGEKPLLDLLNEADTWEKYKDLAVLLNGGPLSIQYSGAGLPMTGIYYADHNKPNYQNCIGEDDNPTPVAIKPGDNTLSGCIQLRHVDAYVKFNIQVEEKYKDLISLTPISWQIFNLPGVSYVHERYGNRNAADTEINNLPDSYEEATYHNSPLFEGAMTFPMSKDGVASFDFYQMENKHIGIADKVKTYNDRELEFTKDGTNTGWYQSLVENAGEIPAKPSYNESLSNNNASYVVIKAHLEYYYKDGEDYTPVNPDAPGFTGKAILRVADAIYTIHLGYCEGDKGSAERAADFNCRRNTKYTYNVYISGADQIRVEAKSEGMTNGVEGTVTDVVGDVIKLDAHYGTFNIQLSDEDRLNLAWRIQAPFGTSTVKMMYDKKNPDSNSGGINLAQTKNEDIYNALNQNQFYNWIQFRPTTKEDVLADYPGDPRLIGRKIEGYNTEEILNAADGGVWYLNELKDVITYPHDDDIKNDKDYQDYLSEIANSDKEAVPGDGDNYTKFTQKRWYTVFVDEYVYEYDYKENYPSLTDDAIMEVKEAWGNFVNKDSRHVWLALSEFFPSTDAESFYANSAYIISQESIQTYYTGTGNNGKALGIEATNESYNEDYGNYVYGVNKAPNNTDGAYTTLSQDNLPSYNNGSYNLTDGRYNMHNYVKSKIQNKWEGILQPSPRTYGSKIYYIPDHQETFMTACLARNRDLNNNDTIDVNEIRWYLPTTENYIQLVLGAVSLRNPLFNFAGYGMDDIQAGKGADISHFAASNNRMVWAEELAATSLLYQYQSPASNFRCIRNLGLEMNQEPNPNDQNKTIGSAYTRNQGTRTIELEYYDMSGLRDYTSGHITAHSVADIRSFPSRKFQYSKDQCKQTNTQEEAHKYFTDNNGNLKQNEFYYKSGRSFFSGWWNALDNNEICKSYFEDPDGKDLGTWRTPNISELAILHIFGDILNRSVDYISSSYEHFTNRDGGGYSTGSTPPYELYNHNFMGIKKTDISAGIFGDATIYLRCVRDVE